MMYLHTDIMTQYTMIYIHININIMVTGIITRVIPIGIEITHIGITVHIYLNQHIYTNYLLIKLYNNVDQMLQTDDLLQQLNDLPIATNLIQKIPDLLGILEEKNRIQRKSY